MQTNRLVTIFAAAYVAALIFGTAPIISVVAQPSSAETELGRLSERGASFLPIWKLLSHGEKQQFIAGYIQGWKDAAKVIDVAIAYVRDNPKQALQSLERIKSLYLLSDAKATAIVERIDDFYTKPENRDAPLSLAISAACANRR